MFKNKKQKKRGKEKMKSENFFSIIIQGYKAFKSNTKLTNIFNPLNLFFFRFQLRMRFFKKYQVLLNTN